MASTTSAPTAPAEGGPVRPVGGLALALQEVFTVVARVRADRQVAEDADAFRTHVKQLLSRADGEARAAGYEDERVRIALYAVVAFLDESVLNSPRPMFQGWAGRPLQEEIFGDHMAGETFYRYLDDLLQQHDSASLADTLEVFQLCLLLGFRGRYGSGDSGERRGRIRSTREKLARIRGSEAPMAPDWPLPESEESAPRHADPWVKRLGFASVAMILLAVLVLFTYRLLLAPGVREAVEIGGGIAG